MSESTIAGIDPPLATAEQAGEHRSARSHDADERWRRRGIAVIVWIGASLLFSIQNYVTLINNGREVPFKRLLAHEATVWFFWITTAPLIFAVARRLPFGAGQTWRSLLLHIPAGITIALLNITLFMLVTRLGFGWEHRPGATIPQLIGLGFQNSFGILIAVYGVTVVVYHTLDYYRAYQRRMIEASRLEAQLAQAQLDALRMQLHPHFLFNTLHGISALMARDVPAARRMIARLSDLLRLSLDDNDAQEVPLAEELEFLEQYIEIQKMRFHDRLRVDLEIADDARDALVPKLLLQPIVENSIRHGISRHAAEGRIRITARVEAEVLRIEVRDNGPGIPELGGGEVRMGVGLGNTRARLEQLYDGKQSFTLTNIPEGGLAVTITLPARRASPYSRRGL